MLIGQRALEAIRDRRVRLAFRRWKKPTVRAGGRLRTALGEFEIAAVDRIAIDAITGDDAAAAGFATAAALVAELDRRPEGEVWRIAFGRLLPDPRVALRDSLPDAAEQARLKAALDRLDAQDPWTRTVLHLIATHPGQPAAVLASRLDPPASDRAAFKRRVRKLKELGLTESLAVGYRLSPRGLVLLERESPGLDC